MRPLSDDNLRLAAQIGADEVCNSPGSWQPGEVWDLATLRAYRRRVEALGLRWRVCETLVISDTVKLGRPGRDAELDALRLTIRNLGAVGVETAVYTWTALFPWLRTSLAAAVRGGALATSYDHEEMSRQPDHEMAPVAEALLWESLRYFLEAVVPAAAEAGVKLALHPDDPPLSPVRGIGRIMISPENYQRALDLVPSPVNGMTFCQGCFSEMGTNVPAQVAHFAAQDRIHFAHFRNLRGTAERFTEQFHDDGQEDMFAVMQAFASAGYRGAMRPDHVPQMAGDAPGDHGYTMTGRLFAVGYMRGLMDGVTGADR